MGIEVGRGTFFITEDSYEVALHETLGNGTKHLSQSHLLRKVQELEASIHLLLECGDSSPKVSDSLAPLSNTSASFSVVLGVATLGDTLAAWRSKGRPMTDLVMASPLARAQVPLLP